MSNDDCNPNDRSRSWVIRLSKTFMKNPSSTVLTVKKAPLSLLKKKLAFKDDKIKKSNVYSNSSKWKIRHT